VTDPESDQAVANTIGSIGTAALAGIMVEKIPVNVLALNGIMPTVESLENGRYPLAKDLHFVTMSPLSVSAQKFLDFIYSDRGRDIVKGFGVLTFTGKE
ncbi:MAG: hypothetical protein RBS57_20040, partial [Desulforhabdus sp.]|nr:hypothetical protein [Desulforhabdus sp.]